ncbi:acylphosphatase [Candidatus Curtissbacteria bacterium RBG_13_40_7]|uniref:acylphosphatase n=1 Tax=Candidatus Curtissbacteria bacterium RBG_13_40_7 TaxID=1797706 RepID=A0A1F5FZ54_9BACT|nr:MAG: acylphosphatase [Candidatus Curtissbacteria bacterium RBG_13_40_7]
MAILRVHFYIYGAVQGVFFRRSAKNKADELGIFGWIRNKPDSTVEAVAQGQKDKLNKFISWCKKGPPFAQVEKVEVEWKKNLEDLEDFSIL